MIKKDYVYPSGGIPMAFIKEQIDTLCEVADQLPRNGAMQIACLLRAEYYMDLVEAYRAKYPTVTITCDTSQFVKELEQLDLLLTHLREGDDGMTKPARNFMEATLHEARALLNRLKKMVRNV